MSDDELCYSHIQSVKARREWVAWKIKRTSPCTKDWNNILCYSKQEHGVLQISSIQQNNHSLSVSSFEISPHSNEVLYIHKNSTIHILNLLKNTIINIRPIHFTSISISNLIWGSNSNQIYVTAHKRGNNDSSNENLFSYKSPKTALTNSQLIRIEFTRENNNLATIEKFEEITNGDFHIVSVVNIGGERELLGILWVDIPTIEEVTRKKFSIFSAKYPYEQSLNYCIEVSGDDMSLSPDKSRIALSAWLFQRNWIANSTPGIVDIRSFVEKQIEFTANNPSNEVHLVPCDFLLPPGDTAEVAEIIGWKSNMQLLTMELSSFRSLIYMYNCGNTQTRSLVSDAIPTSQSLSIVESRYLLCILNEFSLYNRIQMFSLETLESVSSFVGYPSPLTRSCIFSNELHHPFRNFIVEFVVWDVEEGISVPCVILLPSRFQWKENLEKLFPVLICLHGGPDVQWSQFSVEDSSKVFDCKKLLDEGWICVLPNIRGSAGSSHAYRISVANGNWSLAMKDVLYGVRFLIEKYRADPGHICLFGWSYGGFLCAKALMPQLLPPLRDSDEPMKFSFHSVVIGAPVINLLSLEGTSEFLSFFWDYFSYNEKERMEMFQRESPINCLYDFEGDTNSFPRILIIHSEQDTHIPFSQSVELYSYLQQKNIPCEFQAIRGEGHVPYMFSNSAIWTSTRAKIFNFLQQYR